MPSLLQQLADADARLKRSVAAVRRPQPPARTASPRPVAPAPAHVRPIHRETAMDQSMAALQAVVWIASFVQSVFNAIRGRGDE